MTIRRIKPAYALLSALLVILGVLSLSTPLYSRLDALSTDLVLAARHVVFGQQFTTDESEVVVVALDEQTYRTEPFANLPKVLWTPQIAAVQDALLDADVSLIGYDVIFPSSLETFLPGYEKPFLRSLMRGARSGRVVLGKVQHGSEPVAPHESQRLVVRGNANIRALNMVVDVDDIIRRIPLYFDTSHGAVETSMAVELAARHLGVQPQIDRDQGVVQLGDYRIPLTGEGAALINFQGGADIPTYSLADLNACLESGTEEFFRNHFSGKIVLFGGVLDVEDRKLTSKRLMTEQGAGAYREPCRLAPATGEGRYRRDTIPGVYIQATAVNNLLRNDFLESASYAATAVVVAALIAVVCILVNLVRPVTSALLVTAMMLVLFGLTTFAAQHGTLFPVLPLVVLLVTAYSLMLVYRIVVSDQQRNRIRSLFSLYLEPKLVEHMVASDRLPELGGEVREVTVWFSDLANFTRLSEGLAATELVSLMNRYFSVVTDIIEAHGGFVDKYIGDAVVAVFGAPHYVPNHAAQAVSAALQVQKTLVELNRDGAFDGREIVARTGINTGRVVVGNVGSARRFNYTVMGDAVNLASRLEGANKAIGSEILISDEVVRNLSDNIIAREVATIRVKGKEEPTRVYEPLTISEQSVDLCQKQDCLSVCEDRPGFDSARRLSQLFAEAQVKYRQGDFASVIELLEPLTGDVVAEKLRERAKMHRDFPPRYWDGVDTLTEK